MPPWPGLPEGITEGHYRYVNKNLIEMLACLALAARPTASGSASTPSSSAGSAGRVGFGRRQADVEPPADRAPDAPGSSEIQEPADTERANPMLNLTPDQRALGRANANEVIGSTRRDFLKAAAVAPGRGRVLLRLPDDGRPAARSRPRSSAPATKVARR